MAHGKRKNAEGLCGGRRDRVKKTPTMACIRMAKVDDLLQMQTTNLWCLPENYQVRYHILSDMKYPKYTKYLSSLYAVSHEFPSHITTFR